MNGQHFNLRVALPADAAAVTEVLTSAYGTLLVPDYDPAVLAAALPLVSAANPALLASGTYYVQQTGDGRVVSCGGWTRGAPGTNQVEDGVAHLRHFGTHGDWIRHGLGAGIFARCRRDALAQGVRTFMCFSSLSAEAFYTSLGFEAAGPIDIMLRGVTKFPSVTMVWNGP